MNITRTKGEDGTEIRVVLDNGIEGLICRGWLRYGGEQWVVYVANENVFGESTQKAALKELNRKFA